MVYGAKSLAIASVILFAFTSVAGGQQVLQQSLYEKSLELYHNQQYDAVLPYVEELSRISSIELTGIEPGDEELLLKLAKGYETKGRYEPALTMYRAALDISEDIHGPGSGNVADILVNIAGLYELQGKRGIAEIVYNKAIDIRTQVLGENHPDVLLLQKRLSDLRGRMEE